MAGVGTRDRASITRARLQAWHDLVAFLNQHFYKPDTNLLRIALAQYAVHFCLKDNPVWLFMLGPSGGGKSAVIVKGVSFLPHTYKVDSLNPNSFLSGFGNDLGLLQRLRDKHGLLYMSDFSTFLGLRREFQSEIQGQMREIYGGELTKYVGNKAKPLYWKGKVSFLAACTSDLDRHWGVTRNLGERFLTARMERTDAHDQRAATNQAMGQISSEGSIESGFRERVYRFIEPDTLTSYREPDTAQIWEDSGMSYLACVVATLRCNVTRERGGSSRYITGISEPEVPTRIAKTMLLLAKGNAILERRDRVDASDLWLGMRVARGSVPQARMLIVESLAEAGWLDRAELGKMLPIPRTTLTRTIEDLAHLNVVSVKVTGSLGEDITMPEPGREGIEVSLEPGFHDYCKRAGLTG